MKRFFLTDHRKVQQRRTEPVDSTLLVTDQNQEEPEHIQQ